MFEDWLHGRWGTGFAEINSVNEWSRDIRKAFNNFTEDLEKIGRGLEAAEKVTSEILEVWVPFGHVAREMGAPFSQVALQTISSLPVENYSIPELDEEE